jgi:hypothetical protein
MDFLTRQFIASAKRFRDEVPKLIKQLSSFGSDLNEIKVSTKAIQENTQPKQKSEDTEKKVRAIVSLPSPIKTERDAYDDIHQRRDKWRLWVEVMTLLAVLAYGYLTLRVWKEMISARHQAQGAVEAANSAVKVTQEANQISKHQFALDQRPYVTIQRIWIIDPKTGHEITPVAGQPLFVEIHFVNAGKTPALNFVIHRHIVFGLSDIERHFQSEPTTDMSKRTGGIVAQGPEGSSTTAVSLKDTFANETADVSISEIVNWDGSQPIVVFGRMTYEDAFGRVYCTPYANRWLGPSTWENVLVLRIDKPFFVRRVIDLCPGIKPY